MNENLIPCLAQTARSPCEPDHNERTPLFGAVGGYAGTGFAMTSWMGKMVSIDTASGPARLATHARRRRDSGAALRSRAHTVGNGLKPAASTRRALPWRDIH
jgi:hypothetical protein